MVTLLRLLFFPAKVGYRTGRVVGFRRLFVLGAGIAIGLLVAPTPGRELRAKIHGLLEERRGGGGDLAAKVRYDLSHSPRTWHLPQPEVSCQDDGRPSMIRKVEAKQTHGPLRANCIGARLAWRSIDDTSPGNIP